MKPQYGQPIPQIREPIPISTPVPIDIRAGESASIDASGRWRTSDPKTIFDSKLLGSDKQPLFWDEVLESGAGITSTIPTAAKPYIDIVSSDATAGVFTRQTFRRFNYQPGKSQLILMTGVLELASGVLTGCERRIGPQDDNNGIFFESDAGVIGVTVRSNDTGTPIDTTFPQASWNVDVMDGSGVSGLNIDFTKGQIFVFDFEWFSQGRVRFGIKFGNMIRYIHNFDAGNVLAIPWASTPNLPLRYQMITTGDSGVNSMRVICTAVISEGGTDEVGLVRYVSTAGAAVVTDTENALFALVGIRLKSTHLGAEIKLLNANLQIQTAAEFIEWVLLFNPDVADVFTFGDLGNSAIQFARGATANVVTNGVEIGGGYLETGNMVTGGSSDRGALSNALMLGANIADAPDEIVLAARPIGGVSAVAVEGSLAWRETF